MKSNVPEMVLRDGNTYRVLSDQLGSPRLVVDMNDSSNVPYRADYEAFGEVTGTGLEWMPFGFAGGIYDQATGLVRFGARDYDPAIGRWTSKEPLRFDGGKNFYLYADGDPVNRRDPTGLLAGEEIGAGIAARALAGAAAGAAVAGPWGALAGAALGALFIPGDTPLQPSPAPVPHEQVSCFAYSPPGDDPECGGWAAKVYKWALEDGHSTPDAVGAANAAYWDCMRKKGN